MDIENNCGSANDAGATSANSSSSSSSSVCAFDMMSAVSQFRLLSATLISELIQDFVQTKGNPLCGSGEEKLSKIP